MSTRALIKFVNLNSEDFMYAECFLCLYVNGDGAPCDLGEMIKDILKDDVVVFYSPEKPEQVKTVSGLAVHLMLELYNRKGKDSFRPVSPRCANTDMGAEFCYIIWNGVSVPFVNCLDNHIGECAYIGPISEFNYCKERYS